MRDRFDLYGALWMFCARFHSGQGSRGYRILYRLERAGYAPGLGIWHNRFETSEQRAIYKALLRYRGKV